MRYVDASVTEDKMRDKNVRYSGVWPGLVGFRSFSAGNIQVGTFFAFHSDGIILAGLTSPNQVRVFFLDPPPPDMFGTIYNFPDDFMSLGRIIVIDEADSRGDLIRSGIIESGAGAFDQYLI